MRHFATLVLLLLAFAYGKAQQPKGVLNIDEMTKTSVAVMNYIKANDYQGFKQSFAEEISKSVKEERLQAYFKRLNDIIAKEGIPDEEDIQPRLTKVLRGGDTVYVNVIAFIFRNDAVNENPYAKEIAFNFLEKYGTGKIAGIDMAASPLNAAGMAITINKLDSFTLQSAKIKWYRVYYNEGENKITQFGNHKGVFALEGDKARMVESKINHLFDSVFRELAKVKIEKVEEFRTAVNRGKNTQYIQVEVIFDNLPYAVFIYLPIKTASNYKDKIIVRQEQAANLGYQYYINVAGNEKLISVLKKMIDTNWGNYYEVDP